MGFAALNPSYRLQADRSRHHVVVTFDVSSHSLGHIDGASIELRSRKNRGLFGVIANFTTLLTSRLLDYRLQQPARRQDSEPDHFSRPRDCWPHANRGAP